MARKTIDQLPPIESVNTLTGDDMFAIKQPDFGTRNITLTQLLNKLLSMNISGGYSISELNNKVNINDTRISSILEQLSGFVVKDGTKTLSANDFTDTLLTKLNNIQPNATYDQQSPESQATNKVEDVPDARHRLINDNMYKKLALIGDHINRDGGAYTGWFAKAGTTANNGYNGLMSMQQAFQVAKINNDDGGILKRLSTVETNVSNLGASFNTIKTGTSNKVTASSHQEIQFSVSDSSNDRKLEIVANQTTGTITFTPYWPTLATASTDGLLSKTLWSLLRSIYSGTGSSTAWKNYNKVRINSNSADNVGTFSPKTANDIINFIGSGNTTITASQNSGSITNITIKSSPVIEEINGSSNFRATESRDINYDNYSIIFVMVRLGAFPNYVQFSIPTAFLGSGGLSLVNYSGASYDGYVKINVSGMNTQTHQFNLSVGAVHAWVEADHANKDVISTSQVYVYGLRKY